VSWLNEVLTFIGLWAVAAMVVATVIGWAVDEMGRDDDE